MQSVSQQFLEAFVRTIYYRLTDEEFAARKECRDEFYMAIRKKHGIARAQAELFLLDIEEKFQNFAA